MDVDRQNFFLKNAGFSRVCARRTVHWLDGLGKIIRFGREIAGSGAKSCKDPKRSIQYSFDSFPCSVGPDSDSRLFRETLRPYKVVLFFTD